MAATGVEAIAAALTEEEGSIGDAAIGDAATGDAMIEAEWIEAEEEDEGADAAKGGGNDPGKVLCVLDRVADPDPVRSVDPDSDPYSESGSGSRRAKMTHKSRTKIRNFMF